MVEQLVDMLIVNNMPAQDVIIRTRMLLILYKYMKDLPVYQCKYAIFKL